MQHQQKKPTKSDLERRMRNAVVLVPKDKETKSFYFDDKGLRLTVTEDFAVVATMFHQHVFRAITAQGISRPYLYVKQFIEIALANDCSVKDEKGYIKHSYAKLFAILKEKEDKAEHNVCWYTDLWLSCIFAPLYSIGESEAESFLVYESYLHNVARNQVVLSEKAEGMTNKQFIKETMALVDKYCEGMTEKEIFAAQTDDEKAQAEIVALNEQQNEKTMEEQANGDK